MREHTNMSVAPFLLTTLLLSAPIGDDGLGYFLVGGMLVSCAAVSALSWRYGLRWVRQKQPPVLVAVGALVLVLALASSLAAFQLAVMLVFG